MAAYVRAPFPVVVTFALADVALSVLLLVALDGVTGLAGTSTPLGLGLGALLLVLGIGVLVTAYVHRGRAVVHCLAAVVLAVVGVIGALGGAYGFGVLAWALAVLHVLLGGLPATRETAR